MQPAVKDLVPLQASMETCTQSPMGETKSSAQFFRDEKSRVRIETGDHAIISDPVKGESFTLDLPKKIAIPSPVPPPLPGMKPPEMPKMPKAPGMPEIPAPPEFKETADLGEKLIEGVKAHGKEYSAEVPGKPKPIKNEIWTSEELQLPVVSKFIDPASGTTSTMEMKKIAPGAKLDPSLFKVPDGFALKPPPKPFPLG